MAASGKTNGASKQRQVPTQPETLKEFTPEGAEGPGVGLVSNEPLQFQRGRALVGFLPEAQAIQALLGKQPGPDDDTTAATEQAAARRACVAARAPYTSVDPQVPPTDSDRAQLDLVALRPEVQAHFVGFEWQITTVDLRRVLAFQPVVNVETLENRMADVTNDLESLIEFCLPIQQPPLPTGIFTDLDGKGLAISSPNPNLRVIGSAITNTELTQAPGVPPLKALALQVLVTLGASYLQVVHYGSRYFIRDGYHRAVGLLKMGITLAPCVLLETQSIDQVGLQPGMISQDTIFGDRPPLVADFLNDDVASDINRPVIRKVVRLRGDEFVVQG